ncbi:hypothetical protein GF339_05870 [candidate division KSB3 bacterium]|uniref:Uncharacterized protein n=1 Tax=candidate division KSB3 bacterium TaxID=2044937 RepID=A0A9D5Q5Q0_9BACT|nr:hypothetical protein [candidate division KSB3 bacterium]
MIRKPNTFKQGIAKAVSGAGVFLTVCGTLLLASAGIIILGYALAYLSEMLFHGETMGGMFPYVVVVLVVTCTAGLGIPILLLARNIQRSTESFSLLQFDEDASEEDDYDDEDGDFTDDGEELNEFLRKLHKTRNIGPFIPSPKTMDDLCPCGSGLKYKDCCGKFWL